MSEEAAADTVYALASDESVFLRLTRECGWTPAQYADLIARSFHATLGGGAGGHDSRSTLLQCQAP